MQVEIKNRFTGKVIISGEYESVKYCLQENRGASLRGADLSSADLSGAYLSGADLSGAKGYKASHPFFAEIIRRQRISLFTQAEWGVIGQIVIHTPCWYEIKGKFSKVMPSIFKKLAKAGFDEWLPYGEEIKCRN